MKKTMILTLILFTFATVYSQAPTDKQNKIVTLLLKDPAVANLKKNHDLMTEANNPVSSFLERVAQDPSIISIADFKKEKTRYYSLIDNYNSLIDEMCNHIDTFKDYQKLKKIPLAQFHNPAQKSGENIKAFVNDLGKYTNEALAFSTLIPIFIQVGREIYKVYNNVQAERIKKIIIVELTNLKLYKISWDEVEKLVETQSGVHSKAEIKSLVNYEKAECYQILGVNDKANIVQIDSAYNSLKIKYIKEITEARNNDFKIFYQEQLEKIDNAKKHLIPQKAPEQSPEQGNENTAQTDCKTEDMKKEIQTVLETFKTIDSTTKEDLIKRIESLIEKY